MRLTTIIVFLCAAMSWARAQSDSVVIFTPESLRSVIDEQSTAVQLATLVTKEAQEGVSVARNSYLPDITASWEVGYLGNGYVTDRNFSSGMGVHNPHFVNNLAVEAIQTIYSGGAITQGIKLAELRARMESASLEANRQQVKFVVISKLIDLQCLYKRQRVLEQNIDLAQDVLQQMQLRHEQGLLLENDITRYELQIADLGLQKDRIEEAIRVYNSQIATCLHYPEGTVFKLNIESIDENYPLMSLEDWKMLAMTNSPAVEQARTGIEMSRVQLKLTQAERLPYIGAWAYGHFDSPVTIEVPVLNKNFMYWGFGISVKYSLSSLYKTDRKLSVAKTSVMESERRLELTGEDIDDRLTEAYAGYGTACSQLRTQRYNQRLAEQNYEIVSSRFAEGMALVTDLVDAANVKIAAQTGVENASSQLLFCLYRLKYIANDY